MLENRKKSGRKGLLLMRKQEIYAGLGMHCQRKKRQRRRIFWVLAGAAACAVLTAAAAVSAVRGEAKSVTVHPAQSVLPQMEERLPQIDAAQMLAPVQGEMNGMKTEAPSERKDILIVLDPGHGGEDEGCAAGEVQEKTMNLAVASAAKEKLRDLGYQVMLTRENDEQRPSLEERVAAAKDADLFISIHQNACEDPSAEGIEVIYSSHYAGEESRRLADLVRKYAVQSTGASVRELLENEELHVIRECRMPSCLVETGFLSNPDERTRLQSGEYQEQLAQGIASAVDLFFYPKTMYLTFDDGPSAENTGAVLDILKKNHIKATFFLVGENVRKHPEVARRIAKEGHTIGIHCSSHAYDEIYASVDSYLADFEEAHRIVKEAAGVDAKLFRFPGGSINSYNKEVYEAIIQAMTKKGYIYYDWNASLEDAVKDADPQKLLKNALSSTLSRKKVVMLAHDTVYETTLCLDDLIAQLPEYRMEALTEDVAPIQF